MELKEKVKELRGQGLSCSQVVLILAGLMPRGEENPQMVQAMRGLAYGMYSQDTCGALSGGCCALAVYEPVREKVKEMCLALSPWFVERFGYNRCENLVGLGQHNDELCPRIMEETARQCIEILRERGYLE